MINKSEYWSNYELITIRISSLNINYYTGMSELVAELSIGLGLRI